MFDDGDFCAATACNNNEEDDGEIALAVTSPLAFDPDVVRLTTSLNDDDEDNCKSKRFMIIICSAMNQMSFRICAVTNKKD